MAGDGATRPGTIPGGCARGAAAVVDGAFGAETIDGVGALWVGSIRVGAIGDGPRGVARFSPGVSGRSAVAAGDHPLAPPWKGGDVLRSVATPSVRGDRAGIVIRGAEGVRAAGVAGWLSVDASALARCHVLASKT